MGNGTSDSSPVGTNTVLEEDAHFSSVPIPGASLPPDVVPSDQDFAEMNQARKFGNVYKVSFLGESFIVLAGKKALDFFKQNERKYFQVKGSSPESWDELYGTSNPILTAPESVHKLFRRACTTAMMSMKSVEAFYPTLRKILAEFIDAWADRPSVHSHQHQRASEMFDEFSVFVFALSAPVSDDPDSPYDLGLAARARIVSHFNEIFDSPPSEQIPNLFQTFHQYIEQEDPKGTAGYDKRMSDLLVGVLFAAYHAISMSLNGALWELGTKSYLQDRIREEFLAAPGAPNLSLSELNKLSLLNNYVMEVLRLYNAGFGIYRLTVDAFDFGGYTIPQNSKVFIFCGYDHYNVSCPFAFDETRDHGLYEWLPFGVGARSCMGQKFALMEIKTFIVDILAQYRITIPDDVEPIRFPEFEINGEIFIERI